MRFLITILLLTLALSAQNTQVCKNCHPTIYKEFQNSIHKNSTTETDAIHNAIWKLHPNSKKNSYTCAKCHTRKSKNSGVDCLSCHQIKSIKEHTKHNENIYETNPKLLYSAQKGMEDKRVIYHQESS